MRTACARSSTSDTIPSRRGRRQPFFLISSFSWHMIEVLFNFSYFYGCAHAFVAILVHHVKKHYCSLVVPVPASIRHHSESRQVKESTSASWRSNSAGTTPAISMSGWTVLPSRCPSCRQVHLDGAFRDGPRPPSSFAAPIVSGYAAIVYDKFSNFDPSPKAVADRLLSTARTDTISDWATEGAATYGVGEASLANALAPDSAW